MYHIYLILFIILCSIGNRGRGSQWWNKVPSTVVSRLLLGLLMATASIPLTEGDSTIFMLVFGGFMLWDTFGWDKFWSAAIGDQPIHSRLWGVLHLGLRGLYMYPLFIALSLLCNPMALAYGLLMGLQGIPYYLYGLPKNKAYTIGLSEYTWGAIIGLLLGLSLGPVMPVSAAGEVVKDPAQNILPDDGSHSENQQDLQVLSCRYKYTV